MHLAVVAKPPLELDILRKLYYLRKGDGLIVFEYFCLLICQFNANTKERN